MKNITLTFVLTCLIGIIFVLSPKPVSAMPSAPVELVIAQPDGHQFDAQQWGDEYSSGFETLSGYSIQKQADGWWTYLVPTQTSGQPSLSSQPSLRVGIDEAPQVELHLEQQLKTETDLFQFETQGLLLSSTTLNVQEALSTSGAQPVLAILGYYEDTPPSTNPSVFQDLIFGAGKSVREYYSQASYGQLQLIPATESFETSSDGIVGWVNLGKVHPNPSNKNWDMVQTMVETALHAADPYVNFAGFDKDGNKAISSSELHIVLIIAGSEASYNSGLLKSSVWGHKWSLTSLLTADTVSVAYYAAKGSYTMLGEMMGDHPSTIGVMVHELGHELGWPDLYSSNCCGLGKWDIMAFGGWNTAAGDLYAGQTPPLPNAYLQKSIGWIDANNPTQLVPAFNYLDSYINLSTSTLKPYALIFPDDSDTSSSVGEFFIVENRVQTGFDASLPGVGALIWHINEASPSNYDSKNLRVSLVQADGADHLGKAQNYGDPGDAFCPSAINTHFGVGTPLSSAYATGESSNILVTFDFSSTFTLSSIVSAQPMGVMVKQVISKPFNPADYAYSIYLPLAQR